MSKGLEILVGKKVDTFREEFPIGKDRRLEMEIELNEAGRPAIKAFGRATVAARVLAGRMDQKRDSRTGKSIPFVSVANVDDPAYLWFRRGFFLFSHPLGIDVHGETMIDIPEVETGFAFYEGTGLWMTAHETDRANICRENYELDDEVKRVFVFNIASAEDMALRSIPVAVGMRFRSTPIVQA